jgi:arsenate reductase
MSRISKLVAAIRLLVERENRPGRWAVSRSNNVTEFDASAGYYAAMPHQPSVLFLCTHNAGRSQMAAGWLRSLSGGKVGVYSAGSSPGEAVNPVAVAAMAEVGIDIAAAQPKQWTDAMVRIADVIVSMGCGDTCPFYPGKQYLDWELDDPHGAGIDAVRPIRDEIEVRIRGLLRELGVTPVA